MLVVTIYVTTFTDFTLADVSFSVNLFVNGSNFFEFSNVSGNEVQNTFFLNENDVYKFVLIHDKLDIFYFQATYTIIDLIIFTTM